ANRGIALRRFGVYSEPENLHVPVGKQLTSNPFEDGTLSVPRLPNDGCHRGEWPGPGPFGVGLQRGQQLASAVEFFTQPGALLQRCRFHGSRGCKWSGFLTDDDPATSTLWPPALGAIQVLTEQAGAGAAANLHLREMHHQKIAGGKSLLE